MLAAVRNSPWDVAFSTAVVNLAAATRGLDLGNAMISREASVRGGSCSTTALALGLGSGIALAVREGLGNAIIFGA